MSLTTSALKFQEQSHAALDNAPLQDLMKSIRPNFINKRGKARVRLPEFEDLRESVKAIKNHTLAHLDLYLEAYEAKVKESGGHVHFASTKDEACAKILEICRQENAKTVTKGKSMVSEEIGLNAYLEAHGIRPVETDLGEYIIQLRHEPPSHIIAPAVHLSRTQIADDFRRAHQDLPKERDLSEPRSLLQEARGKLREKFLAADVGITGANFLVAETGTSLIVTNEGNGDLTQILPRVHIVLASIEKIVPTLNDVSQFLRVLARSATGQEITVYTTFSTGPRREGDEDGPQDYHVILLDNGRSAMLGSEFAEMLRCIRCGACMNHCPVYHAIGGHAYGSVYPGPMGAVLTPAFEGVEKAYLLPGASTFCGRCESVCPVKIPLPKLMRHWREREFERHVTPFMMRLGLHIWAYFAAKPWAYRPLSNLKMQFLAFLGKRHGLFYWMPLAKGWTKTRDLPAPQGATFQAQWAKLQKQRKHQAAKSGSPP